MQSLGCGAAELFVAHEPICNGMHRPHLAERDEYVVVSLCETVDGHGFHG